MADERAVAGWLWRTRWWWILAVAAGLTIAVWIPSTASARNSYGTSFEDMYPTSTSNVAGCALCHSADSTKEFNEYGWALLNTTPFLDFGALEGVNSDGAAGSNLEEILAGAQPGWTSGVNTCYDTNGVTFDCSPPAGVPLDPGPPPTTTTTTTVPPTTTTTATVPPTTTTTTTVPPTTTTTMPPGDVVPSIGMNAPRKVKVGPSGATKAIRVSVQGEGAPAGTTASGMVHLSANGVLVESKPVTVTSGDGASWVTFHYTFMLDDIPSVEFTAHVVVGAYEDFATATTQVTLSKKK